jgi:hypothetical protein
MKTESASGDIIVTLDGQHDPSDIPVIFSPFVQGLADLVLAKRQDTGPLSEQIISRL